MRLCTFWCKTFTVIALRFGFCCETLHLLVWNVCGEVIIWRLIWLLPRNFAPSGVKRLRWLPYDLAFVAKLCNFWCETFTVIAWRRDLAFAAKLCTFWCETFAVIAWRLVFCCESLVSKNSPFVKYHKENRESVKEKESVLLMRK